VNRRLRNCTSFIRLRATDNYTTNYELARLAIIHGQFRISKSQQYGSENNDQTWHGLFGKKTATVWNSDRAKILWPKPTSEKFALHGSASWTQSGCDPGILSVMAI